MKIARECVPYLARQDAKKKLYAQLNVHTASSVAYSSGV